MSLHIALIGNCHVRVYAGLLKRSGLDVSVELMDFSDPASRVEENRRAFLERIKDMDYVLSQENSLSFTKFDDTAAAGRVKLIKICNFFFRGLYPDSCYVGGFEGRIGFNDYNSVIILGSYLQGLTVEECLRHFNRETFARLGLMQAWTDSMAELAARDRSIDFPGATVVEQLVRLFPIFRTMNHPNEALLGEYLSQILGSLGIRARIARARPTDDPLHFIELPVYDFVAEHFGLNYRTPQFLRIYNNFIDLESFIRKNYEAYAKWDTSKLIVSSPADLKKEIAEHCPEWLTRSMLPGSAAPAPGDLVPIAASAS